MKSKLDMDSGGSVEKLTVTVKGRVTMVGYRAFLAKKAQVLGLTGWVRNAKERPFFLGGEVNAYFEGERVQLEEILEACDNGPLGAGVKEVEAKWSKGKRVFGSFEILR